MTPKNREPKGRNRSLSSPSRTRPEASNGFQESRYSRSRHSPPPCAAALVDGELVTATQELSLLPGLGISIESSSGGDNPNPRNFPYSVKLQCWEKADKIKGRDPERWRRDAVGNIVFRKLVGCPGCLCHDYDHIIPYSKGGKSTLENCQVLQATVNCSKGNRTEISTSELVQKSSYCRVSGRDMDLLELTSYGNVKRGQDSGGCNIQ